MPNLQATQSTPTAVNPAHAHCAIIEQGRTSVDAGHWHHIVGGVIQPDLRDGHTHQILPQNCQAMGGSPQGGNSHAGCGTCTQRRQ